MSGDGPPRPDPDGRDDEWDADILGLTLHVPDDASELEPDRLAFLAELRARAAEPALPLPAFPFGQRLFATRRYRRFGFSGPLLIIVLLAVAGAGSLMSIFAPRGPAALERLPLATSAVAPAGQPDGLLPDTDVQLGGRSGDVRAIRPAVLVLVPEECLGCEAALANVYSQAREFTLRTVLVGTPAQQDQMGALDRAAAGGGAVLLWDQDRVLARAYGFGEGLTLVLVHADGVVRSVIPTADPDMRYESEFVQLPRAGSPGSGSGSGSG